MSLKDVRVAVENFLKSDHPQAIAISGKWGCGKTYFWGEVIENASSKRQLTKYSYVSLFGINSLTDLKSAIFDNAVSADEVTDGATSSSWFENAREALEAFDSYRLDDAKAPSRRLINRLKKMVFPATPPLSVWGGVARSLSFLAIKNYVICLDDVERKGAGLSLKDVLGLVSVLKEQRGCRIVVILNEDELGDDKSSLSQFKEKVFDVEIVFSPSVEECAKLVFNDEWRHSKEVIDDVLHLNIRNIRVLQRIRRVLETLLPYVEGKDVALTRQLIHSSVLLTWCYNSRSKDVPSYEIVKNLSEALWFASASDKERMDEERKLANSTLSDYEYYGSDELDFCICHFLENGYVEEDTFASVIESFQEKALQSSHAGSFTDAWRLFHDTFSENEEDLVSTLRDRFLSGAKWIGLGNAMGTVKLMRELERNDVANEMMVHWLETAKKVNGELLNLDRAHLFADSVDEKFKQVVEDAYRHIHSLPTLGEAIKDIAERKGWGAEQIEVLSKASVDEYYNFFKSIDMDEHLGAYVRACLKFGTIVDGEEKYKKINDNASEALHKIATESRLNKVRISRYLPDVTI